MKYRKKPVVIEAITVRQVFADATTDWKNLPAWFVEAYETGKVVLLNGSISVSALGGVVLADIDDWVIKGVQGELYPCNPDIFAATYDEVEDEEWEEDEKPPAITLDEAKAKVATMQHSEVKAVLRSHGVELWLDQPSILRTLLAEKMESGEIHDPTNNSDTVMTVR